MKILKFILIFLVAVVVFYIVAIVAGFNLPKPQFLTKSIEGNAVLKVTLLMDNNVKNPLSNIEVDVAEKTGPPPKGGVAITDEHGVATFNIKPGNYVIYFNLGTFPKNLEWPEGGPETKVQVEKNKVTEITLLLDTK